MILAAALTCGYLQPADALQPAGALNPSRETPDWCGHRTCGCPEPGGCLGTVWCGYPGHREPGYREPAGTLDSRTCWYTRLSKPPAAAEKYNQQYIRGRQLKKKYDSEFAFRYKRRSLRMSQHNYGWSGTYFVTIRTAQREPLLEIPELRTILRETWEALPQRFPGASLDEFVIMPDHIHFILWLEGNVENPAKLGDIVGAYKSITTVAWLRHIQAARMERPGILWQHDYYERVIRDSAELEKTRQYIRDNPIKQQNKTQNPTGTLEP